ncbi:polysaccharide pyruvyl transferase family protein [Hyphomicrobium sp.]|uniref:polysaccharide pyruvyl transferase family protein n=1 Tax=Hyphomicrobium sp. TaxID=82 RepID=UPI0025C5D307|nr:polysaccharide pyruvyl transferase family protein [Hyphomicrobium sp.]MCC7253456.1 polysaccharide pyruvyl transferase family protein [Hyphomicrobium sp.]
MSPLSRALTVSGKPRLAMFARHSLLDGRGAGYVLPPGDERGHAFLGRWPHNLGDQFVASALGRLLDFDEFYTLTREATVEQFDIINNECHAVIAVMQNALYPGFFGTQLPVSYLKQLKIPVVLLSLGLQFRFGDAIKLTSEDVESLKWLHDHGVSSQVRGYMSQELLARHGIHNTKVLGCPSLLWSGKRAVRLRAPTYRNVGFTITDMGAIPALHKFQFEIMEKTFKRAEQFALIAQGGEYVLQDFLTVRDGVHPSLREDFLVEGTLGATRETAKTDYCGGLKPGQLVKSYVTRYSLDEKGKSLDWYYRDISEPLRNNIRERAVFSSCLSEYLRRARELSLIVGTRLHGNILGISQGTPAVFAVHDYRLKDMVEFLKLPHVSFERGETDFDLSACDWSAFEQLLPSIYDGFADFFDEHGLTHMLKKEG